MERVTGIGGSSSVQKIPQRLRLGMSNTWAFCESPRIMRMTLGSRDEGPTVFAPFTADTDYFGRPEQMWMINFRVRDLDAMAAQLRGAEIEVEIDPEPYPNGRFAQLHDPEGNPIQLWQPE